jgi:hypothetical protein
MNFFPEASGPAVVTDVLAFSRCALVEEDPKRSSSCSSLKISSF